MQRILATFVAMTIVTVMVSLSNSDAQDSALQKEKPSSAAKEFRIDPVHSMALFRVQHGGAGSFYGRFNEVHGTVKFAPESDPPLSVDVKIPIASVDTGSEKLDGHLKTPDFFDAEKHPEMTFKSSGAKKVSDSGYEVTGDLTILGVTKPVTVKVDHVGMRDGPQGTRCGFETTFTIQRSEFGMNYGLERGSLGDETKIILAVEAGARSGDGRGRRAGSGRQP